MSSHLLIQEYPLQLLPSLACEIGVNEAIALQQLHYKITITAKNFGSKKIHDGRWWFFNTYEEWQESDFPFWSTDQIGRIFRSLEKQGLVLSRRFEASDWNQRKWYTIDYANLHDRGLQNYTFLIGNTENTTETTTITDCDFAIEVYKKNISKTVEPIMKESICESVEKYGKDAVIEAMAIAVKQKNKKWSYVEGILKRKAAPQPKQDIIQTPDKGYDF